jgi:hypothetical protein
MSGAALAMGTRHAGAMLNEQDGANMRLLSNILLLVLAVAAAVHGYFFWSVGTIEPCRAAVLRIIQKQKAQNNGIAAGLGVIFARQLEDALRSEGVATCYRAALRGEAPELESRLAPR